MKPSNKDIYNCFRQLLRKHFREYKPDEIHVHEIVQCMRKSWYERKYYSERLQHLSDTKCVILGLGIAVHESLEKIFSNVFKTQGEKAFKRRVYINGIAVDIVGTIDLYRDDMIMDIKTVNKIPDEPYLHHYLQMQAYMWLTDMDTAYIIYICKRDGKVKVLPVKRDERVISQLLERAHYYYTCISSGIKPRPEKSYLCRYCEYAFECESILDGDPNDK